MNMHHSLKSHHPLTNATQPLPKPPNSSLSKKMYRMITRSNDTYLTIFIDRLTRIGHPIVYEHLYILSVKIKLYQLYKTMATCPKDDNSLTIFTYAILKVPLTK